MEKLTVCTVCSSLDQDLELKHCTYCKLCQAWICDKDKNNWTRRRKAMAKKMKLTAAALFVLWLIAMTLLVFIPACKKQQTVRETIKQSLFDAACSGPTYPCALHQTSLQLAVIHPVDLTSLGGLVGAGKCLNLPVYNTTLCRCTDVNTDPTNTKYYSWEVTDSGGDNFNSWNLDQTKIRPVAMTTGSNRTLNFDSSTGMCSVAIPNSTAPAGGLWSPTKPNVDYYQKGMTQVMSRTFSPSPSTAPPVTSLFMDFATCPLLTGLGTISYNTQIVSNDDNTFFMAFGVNGQGQDTAQYITGYRVDTKVCILYNTLTGQVQQAGGIPNVITIGQVSNFYPYTIHSMYLSPGGELVVGVGGTCTGCPKHGPFIWYPATTKQDLITTFVGGHQTSGYLTYLNVSSAPKMMTRQFTDVNTVKPFNLANFSFPLPGDIHMGWQNGNSTDTNPVCMTEVSINQPQPLVPVVPLQNEVYCVVPADGSYIRLAPTGTTGIGIAGGLNFRTQYAISSNGTKGFIAFSSDLGGTLGNTDGKTSTCIVGAVKPNMCRSDVFVVMPKQSQ
jgi:hypothetical protein